MIKCATVSHKDSYDDTEFQKLRTTVESLFPNLHRHTERQIFGQDCWIYRLRGADSNRRVMLMSHHDVAPAEGDWKHPPFSGVIAEGRLWGRGTVDTKTSLFAELQSVEELLEEGWRPPCDVYIGSSHNEEQGGDGIPLAVEWFKGRGKRFDLVLDEGGAVIDAPMPGVKCKCAMLAVHEKGRCRLRAVAKDPPAHAGLSGRRDDPVVRASRFIAEVSERPPFVARLYPEVRMMFEHLSHHMSFPISIVFSNLWIFGPIIVRLMPRLNKQAVAMVGTVASFPSIKSGDAEDGGKTCEAEVFLRCVDEDDLQKDISSLKRVADQFEVKISPGDESEFHSPADTCQKEFSYVKKCVEKVFPHAACAPFVLPANTDARHFTDICRCVVRFAPIEIDAQQFASVHSPNENISISAIPRAVEFYKEVLRGLE